MLEQKEQAAEEFSETIIKLKQEQDVLLHNMSIANEEAL